MPTPIAPLQLEQQHGVATLTFSRPQALNAINVPMALALRDAARHVLNHQLLFGEAKIHVGTSVIAEVGLQVVAAAGQLYPCAPVYRTRRA